MVNLICPICGKEFDYTDEWAYKKGPVRFCSWKCLRQSEKVDGRHANSNKAKYYYTYRDETHTLREWSKISGLTYATLYKRMKIYEDLDKVFEGATWDDTRRSNH